MPTQHPIETDAFYKRLSHILNLIGLNSAERIIYLSKYENWYHIYPNVYRSTIRAIITTLENPDLINQNPNLIHK